MIVGIGNWKRTLRYHKTVKFCTAFLALSSFSAMLQAQTAPNPKVPGTLAAPVPAPGVNTDPNKVILTVGDMKLTAAQYEALVEALPANLQAYAHGASKRQFAENLVQLNLLAQQAEKLNLDKIPKVQEQIAFQRKNMLAQAMFENIQQNAKLDDAAVQQYYDAHKNEYEAVKGKHILIRVKGAPMPAATGKPELDDAQALAKAQDIRKRLAAGADFATIAKAESDDTVSGAQGGDLGEFHKGMMVPPFEQAAFALKPGEISEPVKTPFGYHIIVVTEHQAKPLAEVRPEIEKILRPDIAKKAADDLRTKTNVQIDDAFFGPPPPPAAAAPVAPPQPK
jgi:peptidyl-prolyl cis-trans isomerase C